MNIANYKDNIIFIPLGGASEIGMNVNLYQYKGKWIIVDLGAGFADDYMPGVDLMVADISFIKKHKKDVLGIILTHAHEDHLGGVQYLWRDLGCPIYTTKFTANFLKLKLKESEMIDYPTIKEVSSGDRFDLGPFNIEMVPLTHSAPEMQALVIRTDIGNILHTGDWKFDHDPLIGEANDEELLKSYGREGIMAIVCDSTNVFNPGSSGSEGKLRESLVDIIKECPKMVIVTTFASNLARVETIIHAAKQADRKVVIAGRSLHRIIEAAKLSGYLADIEPFLNERDMGKYPREKVLVICTGCQGEPLAIMNKLMSDIHPYIKLAFGDSVIFSSKIIPGNEKKIFRMLNLLLEKNVEVITERDHFVHVSGHPNIDELKKMYELIQPIASIPVHGERGHIHEHAKLARSWGVKHVVEPSNGAVIKISKEGVEKIGEVVSGYLAVDGYFLLPSTSNVLKVRRSIRDKGVVICTIVFNKNNDLMAEPVLSLPGCLDYEEDQELISNIKHNIETLLINKFSGKKKIASSEVKEGVKLLLKRLIKKEVGKGPRIEVNLVKV